MMKAPLIDNDSVAGLTGAGSDHTPAALAQIAAPAEVQQRQCSDVSAADVAHR